MPGAGRIDRIFAWAEIVALPGSVRQFLVQRQMTLDAGDDFVARGMHLPTRPRFLESVERDDPPLVEIVGVALFIFLIPFEAGERGLGNGFRPASKMDGKVEKRL